MMSRAQTALFALWLVAGAAAVRAQVPDSSSTFTVDAYEPGALPTFDLLNVARTRVPSHLIPAFAIEIGWVQDVLELARDDDARDIESLLVEQRLRGDVIFAVGLFDRFALAIDMPMAFVQSGDDLAIVNRPGEHVAGFAAGDLRAALRAQIFQAAGFGMAVGFDAHLPTGDKRAFQAYDGLRFRPQLIIDWHGRSGLGLAVNLGWLFLPTTYAHNAVLDDGLTWAFGLDLPTPLEALHVVTSVHGIAGFEQGRDPADPENPLNDDRAQPIELDAALELLSGDFTVDLGGGAGLSRGIGAPGWRAFLEVAWSPQPRAAADSDGDGLVDARDDCPEQPEDRDGHLDQDGCPEPDNDGDGVLDTVDGSADALGFGSCRDDAEDMDGFFDTDGCSEPDNDGDGLADRGDGPVDAASGFGTCRDQAEDLDGNQDQDGCPEPDNDGDGVPDTADGPEDKNGFGACRDAPETKNGYRDEDGCPDEAPKSVRVTRFKIEILEKVFFQYDKAIIKPESHDLLDEVARVLAEAPELTLVRVEGHTDHQGSADYNNRLSQKRAESVVAYLVHRGIDEKRLVAKGYGKSRPLVTGPAAQRERGRALNRRVEFVILEVNGQPPSGPVMIDRPETPR